MEECQQLETYILQATSLKVVAIKETVHERVSVDDRMGSQFYGFGMKQTVLENASSNKEPLLGFYFLFWFSF